MTINAMKPQITVPSVFEKAAEAVGSVQATFPAVGERNYADYYAQSNEMHDGGSGSSSDAFGRSSGNFFPAEHLLDRSKNNAQMLSNAAATGHQQSAQQQSFFPNSHQNMYSYHEGYNSILDQRRVSNPIAYSQTYSHSNADFSHGSGSSSGGQSTQFFPSSVGGHLRYKQSKPPAYGAPGPASYAAASSKMEAQAYAYGPSSSFTYPGNNSHSHEGGFLRGYHPSRRESIPVPTFYAGSAANSASSSSLFTYATQQSMCDVPASRDYAVKNFHQRRFSSVSNGMSPHIASAQSTPNQSFYHLQPQHDGNSDVTGNMLEYSSVFYPYHSVSGGGYSMERNVTDAAGGKFADFGNYNGPPQSGDEFMGGNNGSGGGVGMHDRRGGSLDISSGAASSFHASDAKNGRRRTSE